MSIWLIVRAWLELLYVDLVGLLGFQALRRSVSQKVDHTSPQVVAQVPPIVRAMDTAIVLYVKPVLCLQHSIAVTRLLRRRGIDAQVVIGCRPSPFTAHAWVEVAGVVVAQDVGHRQFLTVLDRW